MVHDITFCILVCPWNLNFHLFCESPTIFFLHFFFDWFEFFHSFRLWISEAVDLINFRIVFELIVFIAYFSTVFSRKWDLVKRKVCHILALIGRHDTRNVEWVDQWLIVHVFFNKLIIRLLKIVTIYILIWHCTEITIIWLTTNLYMAIFLWFWGSWPSIWLF